MKLEFKKIQIHNFMSFADEVFDFGEWNGMTLVVGRNKDAGPNETNGAGKSTLWDALLYSLFGETQMELKNENIVNWNSRDRDMRVVLDFSVDGKGFRIERGLNKGKTSYFSLFSTGEADADITKSTIAETQSFLEKNVIMCDMTIFLRTILLTASQTYNFYMMKKADKKEFVEKLFDISVFGDMYSAIHKDALALDKETLAAQNRLMVLNRNVGDYTARAETFEKTRISEIENAKKAVADAQARYAAAAKEEVEINSELLGKLKAARQKISDAIDAENAKSSDARAKVYKLVSAAQSLAESKRQKTAVISKHSELMGRLCDDCRRTFSEYYSLGKIEEEIREIDKNAEKIDKARQLAETEKKTADDAVSTYRSKSAEVDRRISECTAKANEHAQKVSSLKYAVEAAESDLRRHENKQNPYTEMADDAKTNVERESANVESLDVRRRYLKAAESIVSQDTLRKFIIKDLIGVLNNKIRKYLTKLGANYYVEFDENMDYRFVAPSKTCEFGNFSAGQRMRLMIATSFAFRDFMSIRNGLNSNVLVLDEYFDSAISSVCVDNLMKILDEYRTEFDQSIFVISHRQEISQYQFQNTMTVELSGGSSHILKS